jgi:hypothetical protein
MKIASILIGFLCLLSTVTYGESAESHSLSNFSAQQKFYERIGLSFGEVASLCSSIGVVPSDTKSGFSARLVPAYIPPAPEPVTLSNFEVALPHKTQRMITVFEKQALTSYLNHPNDVRVVKLLAVYHLLQAEFRDDWSPGADLEHRIMADYFLNRAKDLGAKDKWLNLALALVEKELARLNSRFYGLSQEENHAAHRTFEDAMFYHEENRYIAYTKLLDDYVVSPNNVYTAFLANAVNLWTGGEAGFDDPTVVYNFVLGSYFSLRTMDLAHKAQIAWEKDPVHNKRFRLASIIGGFSIGHRRFLAKLINDQAAVSALDEEHKLWFNNNPSFHTFTVGYTLFEEPGKFDVAFAYWSNGMQYSAEHSDLITILNRPRYTFNSICMFAGWVDFFLKNGDIGSAIYIASIVPYLENYSNWQIGLDGYEHRLEHMQEIMALYQNNDPSDDPVPFNLKKRKWGMDTMTCQTCHQTQDKVWSEEEKRNILIAPDYILTIKNWPEVSTKWYGSSK